MVLEPWLGRRGSNLFWSAIFAWWLTEAVSGREGASGFRAWGAGMSVAGAVVHFVDWPWSLRWGFLPWLDEAEGLPAERVPAYNTILWVWLAGGVASGLFDTERGDRRWLALGLAAAPALRHRRATTSPGRASRRAATPTTGARSCCARVPARDVLARGPARRAQRDLRQPGRGGRAAAGRRPARRRARVGTRSLPLVLEALERHGVGRPSSWRA